MLTGGLAQDMAILVPAVRNKLRALFQCTLVCGKVKYPQLLCETKVASLG